MKTMDLTNNFIDFFLFYLKSLCVSVPCNISYILLYFINFFEFLSNVESVMETDVKYLS